MLVGKIAFVVTLIMMTIIRYPYRPKGNGIKRKEADRQEQFLLVVLTIGGALLPLIYVFTGWLSFADYNSSPLLIGAGIIITVVGLWLFWCSHTDLGHNWSSSLEIYSEHKLITQGVYQRVRHPMYSASWLIFLGQALFLTNWVAGLGGIVSFGIMYFLRVPKEEHMMLEEFGEQYQQYMMRTGRVFPRDLSQ